MKYRNFRDFVQSFNNYAGNSATTYKPFIKTNRQNYRQLQTQVYKTANFLLDKGLKKGERIMVVAPNSPQWVQLFLACQLIGVIVVPVDARNSLATAKNFAKQTAPKLIFKSKNLLPKLGKRRQIVFIEDLNELAASTPGTLPKVRLSGQETAVIVFTSGTTAEPKGVVLTQRNIMANVEGVKRAIDIDPNWRILSVLPLSHMYELTGTCAMMSMGVGIYYIPRILPLAIAKALNDYKITTILAVPQLLIMFRQRILQTAQNEGKMKMINAALKLAPHIPFGLRRLVFAEVHKKLGGHLKIVITGGAPIPLEVADFWENMGVKAIQGYGLTETGPILTVNHLDKRRTDSQGLKLHNLQLKIAKGGEVLAKGENVFSGYYQNTAQTKKVFTKDGWFKTGDVGRFDGEWLKIQGRAKFAIILANGLNVYPEDIETVAEKHKVFEEICIVGLSTKDGEAVQAVVISDKNNKKVQQAIDDINACLESHQYITSWVRWPEETFPRTLLLKIDRKNIQAWANGRSNGNGPAKAAAPGTADPVINIIRMVIGADIAVKDSERMADLGLDSLRRLSVVSLIEEQMGVTLDENLLTAATTVKQLRKLIKKGSRETAEVHRPVWQYLNLVRLVGDGLRDTIVWALLRAWVKIEPKGWENIAGLSGPAIFYFNHVDYADGAVVFQGLPLRIRNHLAVAAAEDQQEQHKWYRFFTRLCYAGFNFNRFNAVTASLEYTIALIDKGWNIAIAPEGGMSPNGKLQDFKNGIGLLAVESGAPVVPVKTIGLYGTWPLGAKLPLKHSKVIVKIGQPLIFTKKTSYDAATRKLYKTMKRL